MGDLQRIKADLRVEREEPDELVSGLNGGHGETTSAYASPPGLGRSPSLFDKEG